MVSTNPPLIFFLESSLIRWLNDVLAVRDDQLCKFVVCVELASFLVGGKLLVVNENLLDLVKWERTLRRKVFRRVTLIMYEQVTCSPARGVG